MSDSDILDAMKKIRTVAIHARIPESDVAVVDKVARDELITRSTLIAKIVNAWAKQRRRSPKQK